MLWSQAQRKGNVCSCVYLFISLTLWMPTCPSFVGIIFQKHSGRMKRQNVVHESPAGVSKCVNSQRNLSQMSHREKNLSENVTQGKSMSGLLWRSRSAMSTNICKHLSDRILGESETTSKTHKNKHGQVASCWTRSKIGSINLEHWTASDPKWGQAIKMCCAFAALPLIAPLYFYTLIDFSPLIARYFSHLIAQYLSPLIAGSLLWLLSFFIA